MNKNHDLPMKILRLSIPITLIFLVACADFRIRTLPVPPQTGKPRVFVQAITEPGRWWVPDEVFEINMSAMTRQILMETDIYEVVERGDSQLVFVDKRPSQRWEWAMRDWELARKAGRGLHAEYAVIITRSQERMNTHHEILLINVETGRKYQARSMVSSQAHYDIESYGKVLRASYQEVFRQARGDLLATAIRKSRAEIPAAPIQARADAAKETASTPPTPAKESPPPPVTKKEIVTITPPSPVEKPEDPAGPKVPAGGLTVSPAPPGPPVSRALEAPGEPAGTRVLDLDKVFALKDTKDGRLRLAVYDLETIEPLRIVALILSDALREELARLGHFTLVNRENLIHVLKEIELQTTGLLDEKQAVQVGKGLAANQIITGRFGTIGNISIIQAKRVDVEKQETLNSGSLRSAPGQEEKLLTQMPELARKLAGLP